jgi:hypothetical protein
MTGVQNKKSPIPKNGKEKRTKEKKLLSSYLQAILEHKERK